MEKLSLDFNIRLLPTDKGFVQMLEIEDFSGVEPAIWVRETFIQFRRFKMGKFSRSKVISSVEMEDWQNYFNALMRSSIPKNFVELFECSKKNEQISILKDQKISSEQLVNLMCFAGSRYGYKMSKHSAYHYPNIHQDKIWPKIFHINENGIVEKTGYTNLNDNQLKQIIAQRKLVFARILELEDQWHCFYYNDKSITNRENYGKAHIHYISNHWTIPKETLLNELSNRNYRFNGVHIEYISHRA